MLDTFCRSVDRLWRRQICFSVSFCVRIPLCFKLWNWYVCSQDKTHSHADDGGEGYKDNKNYCLSSTWARTTVRVSQLSVPLTSLVRETLLWLPSFYRRESRFTKRWSNFFERGLLMSEKARIGAHTPSSNISLALKPSGPRTDHNSSMEVGFPIRESIWAPSSLMSLLPTTNNDLEFPSIYMAQFMCTVSPSLALLCRPHLE